MRILVADDDEVSSAVLVDRLETLGYTVEHVSDGGAAWEAISTREYRLLILDWVMPVLDGMELVRRIRSTSFSSYVYIVLLTSRTDRDDRLEALDGGADDFLPKPLDEGELVARLKAAERILGSEEELRETNTALEHSRRSELRTGGYIQERLLQTPVPAKTPGWEVARINYASNAVTGDFFEFFAFQPGILDIVAADVMGKGIPAALTGAGVKTSLNRALIELMASDPERRLPTLTDTLCRLHHAVSPELMELSSFLTLCYTRFDQANGTLTYVNCGHPQMVHWRAREDSSELLETTTVPIGFSETADYEARTIQLDAGDLIAMYSDGVIDLPLPEGGRWSVRGFQEWLAPRFGLPLTEILDELALQRTVAPGPASARDDFSCLLVRYIGGPSSDNELHHWATPQNLEEIRALARQTAEQSGLGFTRGELGEIQLAVQEAASNAVRHSRPTHSGLPIRIRTSAVKGKFRVEISYPGIAFDPKRVPEPVLDGSKDGGFGVSIIRQCMDSVMYSSVAGQNLLVFEKTPGEHPRIE